MPQRRHRLLWLLGAIAAPAVAQSPAGSAAGDKTALRAVATDPANANASVSNNAPRVSAFRGWDAPEPCAAGSWDERRRGYEGVLCDREGGRVVAVDRSNHRANNGLGGDVALFAPLLGALQYLDLHRNTALHGDVASLGALTELRALLLSDTAVHGTAASLSGLSLLGERFTTIPGVTGPNILWTEISGGLWLVNTRVAGPVAALRALPGLGSGWGVESAAEGVLRIGGTEDTFSSCNGFPAATCGAVGLAVVAEASSVAGTDECSCCVESLLVRDALTGACCPDCGAHGKCEDGWSTGLLNTRARGWGCHCETSVENIAYSGARCETRGELLALVFALTPRHPSLHRARVFYLLYLVVLLGQLFERALRRATRPRCWQSLWIGATRLPPVPSAAGTQSPSPAPQAAGKMKILIGAPRMILIWTTVATKA